MINSNRRFLDWLTRRRIPLTPPSRTELDTLPVRDRYELWDSHRQRTFQHATALITSAGVLLSVVFTAFGLTYTARTLHATQEGQITDRYTKAVEQLASSALDVRLGAIYALERIAADSAKDRRTIKNVLAAFVRNHDFCTAQPLPERCTASISELVNVRLVTKPAADTAAAIAIATALAGDGDEKADFSETQFPRADLTRARLAHATMSRTDLTFAWLTWADLAATDLARACLTWSELSHANLSDANLRGADLYGANLIGTNLRGADLRGADLREISGLSPDQIRAAAITDSDTRFGELDGDEQDCGPMRFVGIPIHSRN
ncbi:Pentapeptide repeat-containing protein [Nocardia amikacinitolerans]|uniref:pentapeptide repeat-containing protein n=1 Tax=Nocardia amikacinitolerans TaxID=756689 RepID=UPI0020A39EFF|nr:pentapeptide repeat-containing protein [Nocardia amikacinitolerans]MCP2293610.1 Pentapeptide repeat-containing protein [Nocardia amikacinitolerans]